MFSHRFEGWHEGKLYSCPKAVWITLCASQMTKMFILSVPKRFQRFFRTTCGCSQRRGNGCLELEKYWQWFSHTFCQRYLDRHLWTQRFLSYVDFLIRYLISLDISYLNTGDVLRLCWNCASSKLWDQKTRPERLWVPRSRWLPGGLSNDQRKTTMTPTNLGWLDTKLWWILLNFS